MVNACSFIFGWICVAVWWSQVTWDVTGNNPDQVQGSWRPQRWSEFLSLVLLNPFSMSGVSQLAARSTTLACYNRNDERNDAHSDPQKVGPIVAPTCSQWQSNRILSCSQTKGFNPQPNNQSWYQYIDPGRKNGLVDRAAVSKHPRMLRINLCAVAEIRTQISWSRGQLTNHYASLRFGFWLKWKLPNEDKSVFSSIKVVQQGCIVHCWKPNINRSVKLISFRSRIRSASHVLRIVSNELLFTSQ
jgi:hypothetical protein